MHQPSGGIGGTASDIKIQAEQMLYTKKKMAELIAQHTGQTLEHDQPRLRPRPLVHRGRGQGVRLRRPRGAQRARRVRRGWHRMSPLHLPATDPRAQEHLVTRIQQPAARYILPEFRERTANGERMHNPYTKLFEERIIFLGVQIDDASADDVMAQLLTLESMDPDRDISIYINSPGGSYTAMTAIYDTMQFVKPQIQTVCLGQAASAAAVLLAAGRPGQALRPAARPRPDPPAVHRGRWPGLGHRDPGQRDPADARGDGGHPRPAHRPHARAGRQGHRARQDPHRRRRRGVRGHRPGHRLAQDGDAL